MAVVKIPQEQRVIEGIEPVRAFLQSQGIDYERAEPGRPWGRLTALRPSIPASWRLLVW